MKELIGSQQTSRIVRAEKQNGGNVTGSIYMVIKLCLISSHTPQALKKSQVCLPTCRNAIEQWENSKRSAKVSRDRWVNTV